MHNNDSFFVLEEVLGPGILMLSNACEGILDFNKPSPKSSCAVRAATPEAPEEQLVLKSGIADYYAVLQV
jgi:hypothetical protein